MKVRYASCCAIVGGVVWVLAAGCASRPAETTPAPENVTRMDFESATAGGPHVPIQVQADCTVDVEEAHISESKKEEAHWQLDGHPGPLVIEFKEEKGKKALDVASMSATSVAARIKLAKQQGRHPYRIQIGDRECADPVIIIDG